MAASGYTGNPPGSGGGGGGGAVTSVAGRTGAVVLAKADVQLANVDNTSDAAKPVSTAVSTALGLKVDTSTLSTSLATKANLASPTFTGTVSGVTAAMVGLANVDNTADTAKPVSTAQQAALNLKANLASPTFTGTVAGITATMVGLGNVANTTDANKPVSTAQATAIALKADLASPTFTGTPAAPTAAPGTNTTQLASTAYVTAAVAAGGGGGGSTLKVVRRTVTSGNITPQNAPAWAAVTGGPTLVLPAVAGDYVEFEICSFLRKALTAFLDMAVLVGGAPVRYLGTGTASPATEGAPVFYNDNTFQRQGVCFEFVVDPADLSGGNVTVGFATRGNPDGTLYMNTDYPLRWRAMNRGVATVS